MSKTSSSPPLGCHSAAIPADGLDASARIDHTCGRTVVVNRLLVALRQALTIEVGDDRLGRTDTKQPDIDIDRLLVDIALALDVGDRRALDTICHGATVSPPPCPRR